MTAASHFIGHNRLQPSSPTTLRNRALVVLCAALLLLPDFSRADGSSTPVDLVRKTTNELFRAIRSDDHVLTSSDRAQALVDQIVIPHVDLPTISRLVLGKHWRRANAEQQHRFTQAVHRLLLRTYATAVTATDIENVEYLPNRVHRAGKDVTVRTMVPRAGAKPISINYRVRRRHDNWKLIDMVVEGVSLVSTYRSTFGAQVRDKGIDGLIETLNERLRAT